MRPLSPLLSCGLASIWLLLWPLSGQAHSCGPLAAAEAAALSLDRALDRVPDCHPDLRPARAAADAATADVSTAGQRPNPQLSLGANSVSRHGWGSGGLWQKAFDHQVRVDQLVERGDKPGLRVAMAEALRQAAQADVADTLRQARLAVARAHADLLAAQGRREALQGFAQLGQESLRLLGLRVQAGDAPALDATRLRLDDARVQADLRQADADWRSQRVALAALVGALAQAEGLRAVWSEPQAAGDEAQAVAPVPAAGAPMEPVADGAQLEAGLDRRADMVAARLRVRAAQAGHALALAQRTRDLSVGLQFDRYPTNAVNTNGSGNTVSIGVSLPLFVHHAYDGEIARAQADLAQAEAALDKVRAEARAERARVLAQLTGARQRRQLAERELLPAARSLAEGTELAYQRGGLGALDLVEARRGLRTAELERLAAEADWARAWAEWQAANDTTGPLAGQR